MTMGVFDFKSIRQKLERQEQKAEFEEKNPKPVETAMYGWPYGAYAMAASDFNEAARKYMAGATKGFDLPDLRGQIKVVDG